MALDVNLLHILTKRSAWQEYRQAINEKQLSEGSIKALKLFDRYYEEFPKAEVISPRMILPAVQRWYPKWDKEEIQRQEKIIKVAVKASVTAEDEQQIVDNFRQFGMSQALLHAIDQFEEGETPDLAGLVSVELDRYKIAAKQDQEAWVQEDIGSILDKDQDESGYDWRLGALRDYMRGLRPGDFGILAARPDVGKTTTIASEITYLAPQLPKERNVIWFNNEGPGRRIIPRIYQAALGCTVPELIEYKKNGTLLEKYEEAVGRTDRIRILDIHGKSMSQIERYIEQHDGALCIYDMIDNVRSFSSAARKDLVLEELYSRARELAVKFDSVGLATSQLSADAEGERYPRQDQLKDSKTGKQGACDFIITIGKIDAPEYESARWINIPKNKLQRIGKVKDPRQQVTFRPMRARVEDVAGDDIINDEDLV